ncbi:MAG: cache domain-containing protein [Candidatus Woesearchaeota archaeon]
MNNVEMSEKTKAKKAKFRSLTVTLMIAFLALSAVILLISSGLNTYFNFQAQQEIVANQQQLVAKEAANSVKSFVQEKFTILDMAASLGNLANAKKEDQKQVLNKLLGIESAFRQLTLLDAQGHESLKVSRLSSFMSGNLTERAGSHMFSQVKQGRTYISPVYINEVTSEPMVVMTVPVKNVFGDFEGILMAEVNLKFLWDMVGRIKIGNTGQAYVVDRQGNLIASRDISRVLGGENLIRLSEVSDFVSSNQTTEAHGTEVTKGIGGNAVIINYVPLGTPDWAVVTEMPVQEAYASVLKQLIFTAIIVILNIGFVVVAGFYLSRRVTKPIKDLISAAEKISGGDLNARTGIRSADEIGELSRAFDRMAEDLKKSKVQLENYSKTLETQVAERTKKLKEKIDELEKLSKITVGRELKMIELKKRIRELEEKLKGAK